MKGLRGALGFLTPLGGAATPTPAALGWFPVVGAALGGLLGGLWWTTARYWPRSVAAAIVVLVDLALTGLLHMDGLVDSADGLLPHLTAERRLAVMAEPTVGAFGVTAVGITLVLRTVALAAMAPSALLLVGLWVASRTAMAAVAGALPYARSEGGLATAFLGRSKLPVVVAALLGTGGAVGSLVAWRVPAGLVALAAGLAAGVGVVVLARRRLGGFTGDVLGATGVIIETIGLVAAAARW